MPFSDILVPGRSRLRGDKFRVMRKRKFIGINDKHSKVTTVRDEKFNIKRFCSVVII